MDFISICLLLLLAQPSIVKSMAQSLEPESIDREINVGMAKLEITPRKIAKCGRNKKNSKFKAHPFI